MDAVICRKMPHERYPRGASGECVWSRSYVGDVQDVQNQKLYHWGHGTKLRATGELLETVRLSGACNVV